MRKAEVQPRKVRFRREVIEKIFVNNIAKLVHEVGIIAICFDPSFEPERCQRNVSKCNFERTIR